MTAEDAPLPHVLLSCAMSLDGRIDDTSPHRLVLSNEADLDRVDGVRAGCDAILVGAGTVRRDDPRLAVRSPERRAARVAKGLPPSPLRVVLSARGELDARARVFTDPRGGATVVYCAASRAAAARERLGHAAEVVAASEPPGLRAVLADLARRGVARLMVEGGSSVHTRFLAAGLVDELHLVIAPFLVGDAAAPRFTGPAAFPQGPRRPFRLAGVEQLGDVVLLRYLRPGGPPGNAAAPPAA